MQAPLLAKRNSSRRLVSLLVETTTTPCNQVARSVSSLVIGGVSSVGSRMAAQQRGGGGLLRRRTRKRALCWEGGGAVNQHTSRFVGRKDNNARFSASSSSSNARTSSQCSSSNSNSNSNTKNTSKRLLSSPAAVATTAATRKASGNSSGVFSLLESLRRQRPTLFSWNNSKSPLPELTTALPWIGHASYLALASGFLMTDMLQLRLLLVGGYAGLVTFHSLHARPLRIPLRWSAVFVLVNAAAAGVLLLDRHAAPLDAADDEALYRQHFARYLTRGQFHRLLQLGERVELQAGQVLTRENVAGDRLYFLLDGRACLHHGGSVAATIEPGGFVNDVAFQRGPHVGAYGTVVVAPPPPPSLHDVVDGDDSSNCGTAAATALVWDVDALRAELRKRPELERRMKYCWSDHLVQSLLRQREAAHVRQQRELPQTTTTTTTTTATAEAAGVAAAVAPVVETMTYSTTSAS